MAIPELSEFVLDQAEHALTPAKDVFVVGDLDDKIFVPVSYTHLTLPTKSSV